MLLAGARGHALELVDILLEKGYTQQEICLFDDVNVYHVKEVNGIKLITSVEEARVWLKANNKFALATGIPKARTILYEKLNKAGGDLVSIIAPSSAISKLNVVLHEGLNVMQFCLISSNVTIGTGTLVNAFTSVHHDVVIGSFTEIAPGCRILGGAEIGDNCFIGSGAAILPKVKVGAGAIVGAGAVVTKDVEPGATVIGVPATKKQKSDE